MKHLFLLFAACASIAATAQTPTPVASLSPAAAKMPEVDKSPMDMAYYPANFPVLKIQDKATEPLMARVIYSRPQTSGRAVFGELVEWGKIWRLGANEATEIEFYRDVKIGGKKVPKGKYTIYAIPQPEQWTIVLNRDTDTWGAFKYDEQKDFLRIPAPTQKLATPVPAFSMMFDKKDDSSIMLQMAWDNTLVSLPIAVK